MTMPVWWPATRRTTAGPRLRVAAMLALALALAAPAEAQRIAEIQIAPPFLRMRPDAETKVLATAFDADGNPVVVEYQWSSSNINVVQVAPDGTIRAVAPGTAIVTASTPVARGRRLSGRITVFVAHPGAVVMVRPAPGVAPVPPTPPAPGVGAPPPPGAGGAPGRVPNMDSLVRASVNCAEPAVNAFNPMRACWDERATPRDPPVVPVPEACQSVGPLRPAAVQVQVSDQGAVLEVRPFALSNCPQFNEAALAKIRATLFEPARQGGRNVTAWVVVRVHPEHR